MPLLRSRPWRVRQAMWRFPSNCEVLLEPELLWLVVSARRGDIVLVHRNLGARCTEVRVEVFSWFEEEDPERVLWCGGAMTYAWCRLGSSYFSFALDVGR